jgi:cell division septation protein DedD
MMAILSAGILAVAAAPSPGVKAGVDAWMSNDFTGAVRSWRPLADRGDADAQFNMGQAYKLGRGVPADPKIAQSWYQKAAQQGHERAQVNLGLLLFQNGQRAAAMPWIRKAADRGDGRAQYVLGTAYFNGDLAPKDWPRAYALMTRAAAQGLPPAATSLTEMDKYVPLAERQKGIALARQMEASQRNTAVARTDVPASSAALEAGTPIKTPRVVDAKQMPAPGPKPRIEASKAGGWRVQLGAYGSAAAAQAQWRAIAKRAPSLAGLQASYEPAGKFTRLRAGPFADRPAADRACAAAKAAGQACFTVAP